MTDLLTTYKQTPASLISSICVPIIVDGTWRGRLRPVTYDILANQEEIALLTAWRKAAGEWFTTQFPVTEEGTRQWLHTQVLDRADRMLFLIDDEELMPIGQIGFLNYDPEQKSCEFDNLLRGRKGHYGNLMIYALTALGEWCIKRLDLETAYLNVLSDNYRAIYLYQKLGASEVKRTPLRKEIDGEVIRWVPTETSAAKPEKELVTMSFQREKFERLAQQMKLL